MAGKPDKAREFLFSKNAIDDIGIQGKTPLMQSLIFNQEDLALELINKGANFKLVDDRGLSAAHYASANDRMKALELLKEKGADFNLKSKEGFTCYNIAIAFRAKKAPAYLKGLKGVDTQTKYVPKVRGGSRLSQNGG